MLACRWNRTNTSATLSLLIGATLLIPPPVTSGANVPHTGYGTTVCAPGVVGQAAQLNTVATRRAGRDQNRRVPHYPHNRRPRHGRNAEAVARQTPPPLRPLPVGEVVRREAAVSEEGPG